MSSLKSSAVSCLLALAIPLALAAQPRDEVMSYAFTLKHQSAREALAVVWPLLSPRGTVEVQRSGNTLIIRDTAEALPRVVRELRAFDHAPRALRIEIFLVRATRAVVSPPLTQSSLPPELAERLRGMLPFENFEVAAQAQLAGREGEAMTYELGDAFAMSFRLGTVLADKRLKLLDFRLARRTAGRADQSLLHTNLNLSLDQTLTLTLAKRESSPDALMVIITARNGQARTARVP